MSKLHKRLNNLGLSNKKINRIIKICDITNFDYDPGVKEQDQIPIYIAGELFLNCTVELRMIAKYSPLDLAYLSNNKLDTVYEIFKNQRIHGFK